MVIRTTTATANPPTSTSINISGSGSRNILTTTIFVIANTIIVFCSCKT